MEKYIVDQIKYGLKYVPGNLIKSLFMKKNSGETENFRRRAGGFICGVCHPNENYEQLSTANIRWVRFDIPMPFDENGEESEEYINFKERCRGYKSRNFKIMAVTPYPGDFSKVGIDPTKEESKVRETAVFLLNDLRELIDAVQITNEMGIPRFTYPLTMDQAVRFIGIQLEAVNEIKGDILVGYNSAGPQADLHSKIRPYLKYCDYVGIDIYSGCFFNFPGFMWFFDALLNYLWAMTKKPIVLQEFGYIGAGAPKTKEEKRDILRRYGVESEKQARENINAFVSKLPQRMCEYVRHLSPNEAEQGDFIFKGDFVNHLYCELPKLTKIPGYPHTPEGQGKFFDYLIPHLYSLDFLGGAIIYCYSDSGSCYVCSQRECPTETKWGLVDLDGKEKPSYFAVQRAFGKIQNIENEKYKGSEDYTL